MTVLSVLHREIQEARAAARPLRHIRVSVDAIAGAPTTTPIAPERLRTLALRAIPGERGSESAGVVADPEAQERWLEIVIHPEDWRDVLVTAREELDTLGPVRRVFGIEVIE